VIEVSICCFTFGTGRCWQQAGTRLSKLVHFGLQFASCRCSSEIRQTPWSRLASPKILTCRWVVGTVPSTSGWVSEKKCLHARCQRTSQTITKIVWGTLASI